MISIVFVIWNTNNNNNYLIHISHNIKEEFEVQEEEEEKTKIVGWLKKMKTMSMLNTKYMKSEMHSIEMNDNFDEFKKKNKNLQKIVARSFRLEWKSLFAIMEINYGQNLFLKCKLVHLSGLDCVEYIPHYYCVTCLHL